MAYTVNRRLSVQAAGSNPGTWGAGTTDSLNEGVIEIIDNNLGGITDLSLASTTPIVLDQTQANNGMIRMTGVLTASIVIGPNTGVVMQGFYCWENSTTGSYTVTFGNGGGTCVLPQTRRGLLWIDPTNGARVIAIAGGGSNEADPIPKGSVMPFYQNAAPTGWTISAALNDYGVRIVSSSGGVTSGGATAYSTVFATTATGSHTLTTAEIPSHSHAATYESGLRTAGAVGTVGSIAATGLSTAWATDVTGGGDGHTHPITLTVKTADIILATKN